MNDIPEPNEGIVRLERRGDVAVITLARPDKLNALTPAMLRQLASHTQAIDSDDSILVVLVTAEGDRAFCAGADLNAFADHDPLAVWRHWVHVGHDALRQLASLRQPSIAVLHAGAYGGGLELAMACDLRVAAGTARLGLPEVGIGTLPGWGGTARLASLIGPARAKRLVLTGELLDAETAQQWGLVDEVAPPGETAAAAERLAALIASRGPVAVQLAKQVLTHATPSNAEALEALAGALSAVTDDRAEGLAAFHERRTPRFHGQ
ncbi:enoyl-CoA hydratase/carnithine racemase [Streptomyces sp. SLBN-118]|uniref:enoyl-CoA hydratase/isomerase family protein n=1 Tax=Streptomyces sp. SLBN-118 TaxID=2768454 RepID=UPI001154669E|nr:enoyl-CoA hydratase/isomerase family protein [Streptomyces sp. SLBN-118]TQK51257.1 enoyl-CoA hydratase/carnithine racemase [Streptomyces sp. SLBN-118]